ncbi:hypothetical protein IV203_010710 [Nitzschia inconspicua]|uniref:Uncharacterized protein n=1 Tax=Nitzschia inconspicua TaxID=303405 RepID=A0A9K3KWM3_9STRA|nr:hypothetical protein IV203_010710 [Nitzschia inconspicua]
MDPAASTSHRKQYHHSSSKQNQHLDLKVIDDAFGKHSDLYEDVLQVASSATQEEIQLAYFDRRSELFTLLAKIDSKPQSEGMVNQRFKAERKMDSVVLAVRVLGDPTLRAVYDQLRPVRLREPAATPKLTSPARMQPAAPRLVTPTVTADAAGFFDDGNSEIYDSSTLGDSQSLDVGPTELPQVSPPASHRQREARNKKEDAISPKSGHKTSKNQKKNRHHNDSDGKDLKKSNSKDTEATDVISDEGNVIPPPSSQRKVQNLIEDNLSVAMESRQEDDTLAADTMDTLSTTEKDAVLKSSGVFSCFSGSRILRKVSDEISGAFEDTLVSVDQVVNAFTLTDKDIKAVTKKIHKAKRQLDN